MDTTENAATPEETLINEGVTKVLTMLSTMLGVPSPDLEWPENLYPFHLKAMFAGAGIYDYRAKRFAVFHPHYTLRDDVISALQARIADDGICLTKAEATKLFHEHRSLLSADFWCNVVYPEGAGAADIQNELNDFHFLMQEVPKVYSAVTGNKLSKPNYLASVVIAEAEAYTQAMCEEAVDDYEEEHLLGRHAPEIP